MPNEEQHDILLNNHVSSQKSLYPKYPLSRSYIPSESSEKTMQWRSRLIFCLKQKKCQQSCHAYEFTHQNSSILADLQITKYQSTRQFYASSTTSILSVSNMPLTRVTRIFSLMFNFNSKLSIKKSFKLANDIYERIIVSQQHDDK